MADVPKDLLAQIKELEELFTVDQAKLKEVVNHFVKELEKGLSVEGGSIVGPGQSLPIHESDENLSP